MSAPFIDLPVNLQSVRLLEPRRFFDERGSFVKTFHEDALRAMGINFSTKEEYYSVSRRDVVRGMHFQTPPMAHDKLVYCVHGRVLDVLLDLRRSSATYGRTMAQEISSQNRLQLYLPAGLAHGFVSLEENSTLIYKTTSVHSPAHDAGVRWDSFDFNWGVEAPILSTRDRSFPAFSDFISPFT